MPWGIVSGVYGARCEVLEAGLPKRKNARSLGCWQGALKLSVTVAPAFRGSMVRGDLR